MSQLGKNTLDENDPLGMIAYHDHVFGEGSWAELEKGVRSRHPHLFRMLDSTLLENEPKKKWWKIK